MFTLAAKELRLCKQPTLHYAFIHVNIELEEDETILLPTSKANPTTIVMLPTVGAAHHSPLARTLENSA